MIDAYPFHPRDPLGLTGGSNNTGNTKSRVQAKEAQMEAPKQHGHRYLRLEVRLGMSRKVSRPAVGIVGTCLLMDATSTRRAKCQAEWSRGRM